MIRFMVMAMALGLTCVVNAADDQGNQGFAPLFDGETLNGFINDKGEAVKEGAWVADGGVLHMKGGGAKGGNLLTDREYGDFILDWEWKLDRKGNNGIKYRVNRFEKGGWLGLEYQLIDDNGHPDSKKADRQTASIYSLYAPVDDKPLKPIGEWNHSRIVAKGSKVEHWLNGVKVAEADISTEDFRDRVAASKWKNIEGFGLMRRGKIMITDHSDPVWFRNIRIKVLDAAE